MPRTGGLGHPEITLSELQALNSTSPQHAQPATHIDFFARNQLPYKLVWLRMPNGNTELYRLVPDPPSEETT